MLNPNCKIKIDELSGVTMPLSAACELRVPAQYASKSERACAEMLEKHIPGWEPEIGVTYQIAIGHKRVDFKIGPHTFLEWHPVNVEAQLHPDDFDEFRSIQLRIHDQHLKGDLYRLVSSVVGHCYEHRRKDVLRAAGLNATMLVASTPTELYDILQGFGNLPDLETFLHDFEKAKR